MPERDLINGVSREQYGLWCRHQRRIFVPDPTDTSPYPRTIPADPYPCPDTECSVEAVAADEATSQTEYYEQRLTEYRNNQ